MMKILNSNTLSANFRKKIDRWKKIPILLKISYGEEKKATLEFDSYSEQEILDFFEHYIFNLEENAFYGIQAEGIEKGILKKVLFEDILYFEAIQEKVFFYTCNSAYQLKMRLYEVQEIHPMFIRINKSITVNIFSVNKVLPSLNGRLMIELSDGQELEVSRRFSKDFKEYLER
ncbi:LytTR family DNA-binding domain-containing protein [Bacillus cytotoxicus]|uniref:LytTR family DNA-binding domain-containing protein n=2 Tax=Bacillus cytotoxicus TaxID=580165 RepID=UPI000B359A58|nr:LytTR family DNA-binding domain-containing protein [Bacillus cytotoxicus]AWC30341.1 LytTR family transcriptional regulator [Bacillus cytotoxicus]AWC42481.1 LytTR family transcriptional regulator [Bacillus cytotoxicus]AWC50412.1 LytTR family transcriptional regulator [Bacillus cytotoxicus]AWC66727.1 LytTR family transcriptional regulator [Bacillus cytotoxicus]QTR75872.1 LytTR family transcriptional regulator [Bacillus cytotoxicus]